MAKLIRINQQCDDCCRHARFKLYDRDQFVVGQFCGTHGRNRLRALKAIENVALGIAERAPKLKKPKRPKMPKPKTVPEVRYCLDCGAALLKPDGTPRHGLARRCNSGPCRTAQVTKWIRNSECRSAGN